MKELITMEEVQNKTEKREKILSLIVACFVATTLFIISTLYFQKTSFNKITILETPLVFPIVFGIIIYSLIAAITKKTFRATVICYIFIFIIGIINELKIIYTGEPLYFSDINFLGKSTDLFQLIIEDFSKELIFKILIEAIIFSFILEILSLISYRFDYEIKSTKIRIGIIVVDIIILFCLFFPNTYMKNIYLKIFFDSNNHVDFDSYTRNYNFYKDKGFITGMYGIVLNNRFTEPEDYDENKLDELVVNTEKINNQNLGKPNIILLFSESFWDIDQLDEIEFDKPITSNFNSLKNEGKFVNLVSPTYGGLSENVAFELVTGGSMNYFPKGYIPIMSLYNRKNSLQAASLVKELSKNGYSSEILFGKDYYNSEKAYKKIGFENYKDLSVDFQKRVPDDKIFNMLKYKFNQKDYDNPLFYMVETIEAHMPFKKSKYENYDISIIKSNLTPKMNETIRAYAQSIYNADKELGKLYEYMKSYDEPILLIYLGDHLPYLYVDGENNVIERLDYFNTDDELLNTYRLYNTQALVLANFELDNFDIPQYLGADTLFNYILNHFNIELDPYYRWLYNTIDVLPASNKYISLDKEGNIYSTNKLTGEMKEVYDNKELMQYKYFIDAK